MSVTRSDLGETVSGLKAATIAASRHTYVNRIMTKGSILKQTRKHNGKKNYVRQTAGKLTDGRLLFIQWWHSLGALSSPSEEGAFESGRILIDCQRLTRSRPRASKTLARRRGRNTSIGAVDGLLNEASKDLSRRPALCRFSAAR
jgi:hypothetical protein